MIFCQNGANRIANSEDPDQTALLGAVSTLVSSFLFGSSSYLHVTRTTIISRTSSNFGQIGPRTVELAALERLKKFP